MHRTSNREAGLQRTLTAGQMSMIAIGGAIGTGLFLGSKFAIGLAGPSVILSYTISGFITLLLMGCLAEMTIAHPTSGSFGAYAEHYISPLAGYLVRWAYWTCIVMGVGTEVTAIADYMQFWFTGVPPWIWIVLFSGVLIGVNAWSVKTFGTVEYWFSTIKILAIVGFILLGALRRLGHRQSGLRRPSPHGARGLLSQGRLGHVGGRRPLHLQLPEHRDDRRGGRRGGAARRRRCGRPFGRRWPGWCCSISCRC